MIARKAKYGAAMAALSVLGLVLGAMTLAAIVGTEWCDRRAR